MRTNEKSRLAILVRRTVSKFIVLVTGIVIAVFLSGWSSSPAAQTGCLSDEDVKRMLTQINSSPSQSVNQGLRDQLLKLKAQGDKRFQDAVEEARRDGAGNERMRAFREKNTTQLCPILMTYGWPNLALVGRDGEAAALFLLKNSSSVELQRKLLRVIVAIADKGEIDRADLAGYVDRLRISLRLKQMFGTEATIQNGFLVLYPIEAEAQVDLRRNEYHLPPLSEYLRFLERTYQMPLVKSPGPPTLKTASVSPSPNKQDSLFLTSQETESDEIVRVETTLVSLDVTVYSRKVQAHVSALGQNDFKVFEDDHEEKVTFFSTAPVPFDLVLLIDLSGSTSSKRDLIRKSTRRFIEATRPTDRVAIVTFSDFTSVITPLTGERPKLLEGVEKIEGTGGTRAWDALKFTLDNVMGPRNVTRRRAIVFMTDGADNHLLGFGGGGSKTSFADLLEAVRRSDALIIPVCLRTEGKDRLSQMVYEYARKTLAMLAEESGGLYYTAKKIEDLDGAYDQVIEDLGKIYSLGYRPTNPKRDGTWRNVRVQINEKDFVPKARKGYYAK